MPLNIKLCNNLNCVLPDYVDHFEDDNLKHT